MAEVAREKQGRLRNALRAELTARFGYPPREESLQPLVDLLQERLNPGESFLSSLERMRELPLDAPLVQAMVARTAPTECRPYQGAAALAGLRDHVLAPILHRCQTSRTLRVWSAGTGTGTELYELSMLLGSMLSDVAQWRVSLVGTDIDRAGLQQAREAVVSSASLRSLTALERSMQFDSLADGLARPKPRYRRHVSFELHNLTDPRATPPSPGTFDLVLCGDVARHFSREARETMATQLRESLGEHGVWVAASSDPVPTAGFRTSAVAGLYIHKPDRTTLAQQPVLLDAPSPASTGPASPHPGPAQSPRAAIATTRQRPTMSASLRRILREVQALADMGNLGEAAARLAHLEPQAWHAPDTHLLAAMVYDGLGRTEDAKSALRRAQSLDPHSADILLRLGLLLARSGDRPGAIETLRAALAQAEFAGSMSAVAVQRVAHAQLTRLLQPL